MRKNRQTEPRYRRWAVDLVAKRGEVRVSTLVNGGAEVHECSTSATEKYPAKLTSEFGPLNTTVNSEGRNVVVLSETNEYGDEEDSLDS